MNDARGKGQDTRGSERGGARLCRCLVKFAIRSGCQGEISSAAQAAGCVLRLPSQLEAASSAHRFSLVATVGKRSAPLLGNTGFPPCVEMTKCTYSLN